MFRIRPARPRARGFSLIEVLVVVAIILIIAAISIPQFLRARMKANEASAVSSLRTITTVQVTYVSTYQVGYAPALAALGPPIGGGAPSAASADLLDSVLASGIKNGYSFVYNVLDVDGNGQPDLYTVNANPVSPGQTGERFFYVDQTHVLRFALGGPADATSEPVPK